MHRRQGDLLEIYPCVLQVLTKAFQTFQSLQTFQSFQDIPDIPVFPDIPGIPDIPVFSDIPVVPDLPAISDIPVIHDLSAYPGNSTSSSISRESTPFQHSPIRMHILHILQILQFDWFPQKTPPSTSWTIQTTNITFFKEREMLQYRSNKTLFSRIELFLQSSCQVKRLITRMTFNSFLSCLMSKESMEITINTSKWHERAKQWNGNSHISLIS